MKINSQLSSKKVAVIDAETNLPIAGATIDLHIFPSVPEEPEAGHPQFISDATGEVVVSSLNKMTIWQVRAGDYIEQRVVTNDGSVPNQYASHPIQGLDGTIYLYHLPEPHLSIQIQPDYKGLLTINLQPAEGFAFVKVDGMNDVFLAVEPWTERLWDVGDTRQFSVTVSATGSADLIVTPLLYNIQDNQVQIYEQDKLLPHYSLENANHQGRGVWGNINDDDKRGNHQIHLFVGTRKEYLASQQ